MSEISPNHPTMRPVTNGSPRPDLSHSGIGYCAKCGMNCVLLDDYEKYGQDLAFDASEWEDE